MYLLINQSTNSFNTVNNLRKTQWWFTEKQLAFWSLTVCLCT